LILGVILAGFMGFARAQRGSALCSTKQTPAPLGAFLCAERLFHCVSSYHIPPCFSTQNPLPRAKIRAARASRPAAVLPPPACPGRGGRFYMKILYFFSFVLAFFRKKPYTLIYTSNNAQISPKLFAYFGKFT
jgi:hypothetical protein